MDPENIMSGLKNGDDMALAAVFKLFHKGLYYFARQLVNNGQQAEDIVAGAFIQLSQKQKEFDTMDQVRTFLYITILHSCYERFKHGRRKIVSPPEIFHPAEKNENYIESRMIKAELFQTILLEVESLSPIRRKIFKMVYVDDLSMFEIAKRLNITMDTVRLQKARALADVRSTVLKNGLLLVLIWHLAILS